MKIRILQFAMRRLYAIATSGNDVVVFQNPDDINDFCNAGCLIDRRKAVLINGSGVDIGHYAVAPLPEQPVFLMMARLLGSKGVREYAAAAKCITSERSGCRFMLAGYFDGGPDGISPDELREWEAEGLEYVGMLSDVRPTIRAASIYVLPSYREGTPRSVLEAMAMGRPIITTDVPGCRETVVDGVNGFLVAPRNSADLARAMRILACDNGLRTRMGIRSLQLAKEKYAVDNVNFALLNHLSL